MRRIIFGSIWLTGFLAVLLSWGMMWTRAQGEGPSLIIATMSRYPNCQLVMLNPETGAHRSLGEPTLNCTFSPIGWVNDWFYYEWNGIERVNVQTYRREILLTDVEISPMWLFLSPDGRYLMEAYAGSGGPYWVASNDLENGERRPILNSFNTVTTNRTFSPNGQWLITYAQGWHGYAWGSGVYLAGVDGSKNLELSLPRREDVTPRKLVYWSDLPEWWVALYSYSSDGEHYINQLYRMRPLGQEFSLLASSDKGPFFSGWVHPSGIIGLQTDDVFTALDINTGEMLWQLEGVETVLNGSHFLTDETLLAEDWVHFKMTDGRLARRKIDGTGLAFYDTQNLDLWDLTGWSNDGEWLWFPTNASNPELVDVVRIQRDTGRIELVFDERYLRFERQSPDGEWLYYQDEGGNLNRINLDGQPKSEIVVPVEEGRASILTWTSPYQAEWQPTHTLAIGIGLMSFSTLTPIALWRRRRKPRIIKTA